MFCLESDRLTLIPLTHQQLLWCRDDRAKLEQSLGLQHSDMQIAPLFRQEMDEAMEGCWLPDTAAYPDLYPWYTNWEMVCKKTRTAIGSIGFGGYPDDYGQTSIGYVIDEKHWGKGYATEAIMTLLNWGFSFSTLMVVTADTTPNNLASQKVLLKAGFRQKHTENGLLYFKLSKQSWNHHRKLAAS
jgi:ribosomal-protein-alanine N-acetyltransferase